MSVPQLILWGCVGALLPDLIDLTKYRTSNSIGCHLKSPHLWIQLVALVILGAFAAYLAGAVDVKQAVLYGYSGPKIISALGGKVSEANLEQVVKEDRFLLRVRRWWGLRP